MSATGSSSNTSANIKSGHGDSGGYSSVSNTSTSIKSGRSTPTKDDTPEFCKRVKTSSMEVTSHIETQKELVELGRSMAQTSSQNCKFPQIKTMSLEQLHDYVEKKLSKEHYSPEVIYLLFQIQSLLLEKENLNNNLSIHITTITELKKDLIAEKTLISDLKDSIRESTTELEEIENENERAQINAKTEYTTVTQNYQIVIKRKNLYEKILMYLIPITILELAIFIAYVTNICYYLFSELFSLIKIWDYQQIPAPQLEL